jgi:hypothetical protein
MILYDVSIIVQQMRREGRPTTAEALLVLWRRALFEMDRKVSALRVVDPRDDKPITGPIPDLDSVMVIEEP